MFARLIIVVNGNTYGLLYSSLEITIDINSLTETKLKDAPEIMRDCSIYAVPPNSETKCLQLSQSRLYHIKVASDH